MSHSHLQSNEKEGVTGTHGYSRLHGRANPAKQCAFWHWLWGWTTACFGSKKRLDIEPTSGEFFHAYFGSQDTIMKTGTASISSGLFGVRGNIRRFLLQTKTTHLLQAFTFTPPTWGWPSLFNRKLIHFFFKTPKCRVISLLAFFGNIDSELFTGCQRSLIPCVTAKLTPISAFLSCLGQLWFWAPFSPSHWHIRVDSSEYLLPGPGEHNDSETEPLSPLLLPCMSRFSGRGVYLLQSLLLLNDLKRFHFIGVWCIFILNTCSSPPLIHE